MTATSFTDFTLRHRTRTRGVIRIAHGRLVEVRSRHGRRYAAASAPADGADRMDMAQIERRSLFEGLAPERF